MAEDEVVTTGNALPAASAGIGAVIDTNERALDNEDAAIKTANDYIAQQRKNQQAAFANSQVIMKGLNLKPDGARPQDIPILQDKAAKIMDNASLLMGSFNGNLSSPAAQQAWFQNVARPQQEFEANVQKSKGIAKLQLEADNEFKAHPDFYDAENYNQNTAHIASLHLDNPDLDKISGADLLKRKPPDGETLLEKYAKTLKNLNPVGGVKNSVFDHPKGTPQGYDVTTTTTENFTQPQVDYFGENYRNMPEIKTAMDSDWEGVRKDTPGVIENYAKKYLFNKDGTSTGISPVQADRLAEADWVKGRLGNGFRNVSTESKLTPSEQSKLRVAAARASTSDEKNVDYGQAAHVSSFMHGDPAAINSIQAVNLLPFTHVEFNDDGTPEKDANKNIKTTKPPNGIESVIHNADGSTDIQTTETKYLASLSVLPPEIIKEINRVVPGVGLGGAMHYGKYDGRALYQLINHDAPADKLNQVDKAYKELNAIVPTGSNIIKWDPDVFNLNYARKQAGQSILKYADAIKQINSTQNTSSTQKDIAAPTNNSSTINSKSKTGKDIYSIDGGKTWLYKKY